MSHVEASTCDLHSVGNSFRALGRYPYGRYTESLIHSYDTSEIIRLPVVVRECLAVWHLGLSIYQKRMLSKLHTQANYKCDALLPCDRMPNMQ